MLDWGPWLNGSEPLPKVQYLSIAVLNILHYQGYQGLST